MADNGPGDARAPTLKDYIRKPAQELRRLRDEGDWKAARVLETWAIDTREARQRVEDARRNHRGMWSWRLT
jgi:hypothetical protein